MEKYRRRLWVDSDCDRLVHVINPEFQMAGKGIRKLRKGLIDYGDAHA